MNPNSSLLHSQDTATCPYLEPDQSSHVPISLPKFNFNIIFPSTPGYPKWPLSLRFPHQNHICTSPLPHICYVPPYLFLDLIIRIIFAEEYRTLSSSRCSLLHSPITSTLLGPNILLSILFSKSNTLSLRFTPSVSDQLSHPYKETGKIIIIVIK